MTCKLHAVLLGDAFEILPTLPDGIARACVTSPPYWNCRKYGPDPTLGDEHDPVVYVDEVVRVLRPLRRVLTQDGHLWLDLGDIFAGLGHPRAVGSFNGAVKARDVVGLPWRIALALQADGWHFRADIVWQKTDPLPDGARGRPMRAHEYLFLFAVSPESYFTALDLPADGYSVWSIANGSKSRTSKHPARFPPGLVLPCVRATTEPGDLVIDPFSGSGTTGLVAVEEGRRFLGIEMFTRWAEESRIDLVLACPICRKTLAAGDLPAG